MNCKFNLPVMAFPNQVVTDNRGAYNLIYYLDVFQSDNMVHLVCLAEKNKNQVFLDTHQIPIDKYDEKAISDYILGLCMASGSGTPDILFTDYSRRFADLSYFCKPYNIKHEVHLPFPPLVKSKIEKVMKQLQAKEAPRPDDYVFRSAIFNLHRKIAADIEHMELGAADRKGKKYAEHIKSVIQEVIIQADPRYEN